MANYFRREASDGGDFSVWAVFEQAQNHSALSLITLYLYNDAGALKSSTGRIGLDNGSNKGTIHLDSISTVSLIGLTASRWAQIEASVIGTVPTLSITSIGAGTDPAALPAAFTGAYVGDKGGYYITGTKRVIGLAWINAGGNLEGIVNCLSGKNYAGYSQSDDANDDPYYFLHLKSTLPVTDTDNYSWAKNAVFTAAGTYKREVYSVTTAAASFLGNIPALAAWKNKRIKIIKVDTGVGVCTVTPNGAETFLPGATAFPLRYKGDFIELESDGTQIIVVASLATLVGAALALDQWQSLAHGMGVQPRIVQVMAVNLTPELGYVADDETYPDSIQAGDPGVNYLWCYAKDATNIYIKHAGLGLYVQRKDTGAYGAITMASWTWKARYSL